VNLVRTSALILLAGLVVVAPALSPMHAHDGDAPNGCRVCQTGQIEILAGAAVTGVRPPVIALGTTERQQPGPIAAERDGCIQRRAPPDVV
jgi:hypothetical protein